MGTTGLGFSHRFVPASEDGTAHTLLLLHGTGGDENDLVSLGQTLAPGAALLSPRGQVLERGIPRFFRRLAEGVFDQEDLVYRTHELAQFVEQASAAYRFDRGEVVAVGYSNGANIAASLLLLHPRLLAAAVLFHAMVPLEPTQQPNLGRVSVFATAGRRDPLIPPQQTERLLALLHQAGADVTAYWQDGGHNLSMQEVEAARRWLATWMAGANRRDSQH